VSAAFELDKAAKVYVAGHRGLVGSAITRRLRRDGYRNLVSRTSAELDLRDQAATYELFDRERPKVVILAAAKVGGILANEAHPADFIADNLQIATNVITAAYRFGVRKLVNLASSAVYPPLAPQPLEERSLLSGQLEPTHRPYAIAKIAAIELCDAFNAHDLDRIMALFADDCVLEMPRGPEPWGSRFEGKAAVRAALAGRFAGLPDVH